MNITRGSKRIRDSNSLTIYLDVTVIYHPNKALRKVMRDDTMDAWDRGLTESLDVYQ